MKEKNNESVSNHRKWDSKRKLFNFFVFNYVLFLFKA